MLRRCAAVLTAAPLALICVSLIGATSARAAEPAAGTIRISEVESNGDAVGDWIELQNTASTDATLTGWWLQDSDPTDHFVIPDGTVIPAGGYAAFVVDLVGGTKGAAPGHFGLGAADSAIVYDASSTLVDRVDWTAHAGGTYDRCADDAAGDTAWVDVATSTFGAANQCPDTATVLTTAKAALKVDEVVADNATGSDGLQRPDWIELANAGPVTASLSGWWLSDDTATDKDAFAAGTSIAPGGYAAYAVGGSKSSDLGGIAMPWGTTKTGTDFGLGASGDQAALVAPDGSDADRVAWGTSAGAVLPAAATGDAIARDASSAWVETTTQTPGAANTITAPGGGTGGGTGGGGTGGTTGPSSDITLNEVRSSAGTSSDPADDGNDFFELINTGTDPVDLDGWTFTDGDGTAPLPIATTQTLLQPAAVLKVETGTTGLGKGDAINVSDSTGAAVISFRWPAGTHATPSYARCPDGLGSFQLVLSTEATPGQVNDADCPSVEAVQSFETTSLILNEVSMNSGGGHGDFIEVKNIGATALDLTGMGLSDDKHPTDAKPDWQPFPDGTVLAPGDRAAYETTFGLGGDQGDQANIWLADKTTLVDQVHWIANGTGVGTVADPIAWPATTSIGRCPDDANTKQPWQDLNTVTFAAQNDCTAYVGGIGGYDPNDGSLPWLGGSSITTTDSPDMFSIPAVTVDGVDLDASPGDASGAVFDPSDPTTLWIAKNKRGSLWKLTKQSDGSWAPATGWEQGKDPRFVGGSGHPDTEGLTIGGDGHVYMTSERDNDHSDVNQNMVLEIDQDMATTPNSPAEPSLPAIKQWDLTSILPNVPANLGLEGITFVPDSYLTAGGFLDQSTGAAYDPAHYPGHGTGLFIVAFEGNGDFYAFALNSDGTEDLVATISTGFPSVMDAQYDPERGSIWATCDNTCSDREAELRIVGGTLTRTALYQEPGGMTTLNNEGFAVAPQSTCVPTGDGSTGQKEVVWTDDGNTDSHSLRSGTIPCTPLTTTPVLTDPTISATVTPAANAASWRHQRVTVTWVCVAGSAPVDCPAPTVLGEGKGQTVTKTITATDGGTATATAGPINVDLTKPMVSITGVKADATYAGIGPKPGCHATDALSGVASCRLAIKRTPTSVTVTATATDRAGNTATARASYKTRAVTLAGARLQGSVWKVVSGHRYTLTVLTSGGGAPRFLAPVRGHTPGGKGIALRAAGVVDGVHVWKVTVRITLPKKGTYRAGIRQGRTLTLVKVTR